MTPCPSEDAAKKCFKCKQVKSLSEFYRHPRMADGHLNKCRCCTRMDVRINRAHRSEQYIAYDRQRGATVSRRESYRRQRIAYRARHPERTAVYCRVYRAKKAGVLIPPVRCPGCGAASRIDAHHEDYRRPLDVTWICPRCHHAHHHICNYFTGQSVA